MTAPLIRVVDHMPFEAAVSPEQALAYCRRVLRGWEEVKREYSVRFNNPDTEAGDLAVPTSSGASSYEERMGWLCDSLVEFGFATQPSEVLRAMAAEVVT